MMFFKFQTIISLYIVRIIKENVLELGNKALKVCAPRMEK